MQELDFTIEMNAEGIDNETEAALFNIADASLRGLAKGHNDLTGAAITVKEPAKEPVDANNPSLFETTIVVYARPDNIAATKKDWDANAALAETLDAIERQLRKKREKLRKEWQDPSKDPVEREVLDLASADESNYLASGNGED